MSDKPNELEQLRDNYVGLLQRYGSLNALLKNQKQELEKTQQRSDLTLDELIYAEAQLREAQEKANAAAEALAAKNAPKAAKPNGKANKNSKPSTPPVA